MKGNVHLKIGDIVKSDEIVASTELPGNVQMLNVASKLNIEPENEERFCKESRQATMGRLSEMGLVNWMIYSKKLEERLKIEDSRPEKYGKSCFVLNESMKNNW